MARSAAERGTRVISVNWGTWEAMRLASPELQASYERAGLSPMPAAEALDALGRLISAGSPRGIVARVDWDRLKPLHEARRARPFLAKVGVVAAPRAPRAQRRAETAEPGLPERLAGATDSMRRSLIDDFVRRQVSSVLGLDPSAPISAQTGLFALGMDSLMSVELRRRLETGVGRPLPSTLTFNYPNVNALVEFLFQELQPVPATASAEAPRAPVAERIATSDLDALTDEELEARLRARLEQTR
jgi:acyl carrier protein